MYLIIIGIKQFLTTDLSWLVSTKIRIIYTLLKLILTFTILALIFHLTLLYELYMYLLSGLQQVVRAHINLGMTKILAHE